jgi:hypothetical protein
MSFKPKASRESTVWIWTGTNDDGSAALINCNAWTSVGLNQTATAGLAAVGTRAWLDGVTVPCDRPLNLACFGITRSSAAPRTAIAGKRMWVSSDYLPGSMTPDQKCQSDLPAGVSRGVAFIDYSNRPADSALDATASYVRPDGALVGTGAAIANRVVIGGPWVHANGTVGDFPSAVWTGADGGRDLSRYTCNDWGSSNESVQGGVGDYGYSDPEFFDSLNTRTCDTPLPIFCVEP